MEEIKMTQAELDALIAEKMSEARNGLYTEDDLKKKVTSEVDRRVESGIQKGLETYKSKWQKEFEEKANLTAEEIAQKEIATKMAEVQSREKEIQKRANQLEALSMFAEAGIQKKDYEKLLGVLINEDAESTKANVSNFIELFNSTKKEVETKVKSELGNVTPPKSGTSTTGVVTKEQFAKLSYGELVKFKEENPDLYKQFLG